MGKVDKKNKIPKLTSPTVRSITASWSSGTVKAATYNGALVLIPPCDQYRIRGILVVASKAPGLLGSFNVSAIRGADLAAGSASTVISVAGTIPGFYLTAGGTPSTDTFLFHVDASKSWRARYIPGSAGVSRTNDTNLQLTFTSGNLFSTSGASSIVPSTNRSMGVRVSFTYDDAALTETEASITASLLYEPLDGDDFDARL